MGENTKIEWAHHTFNPWYGCQKVGPGCDHCYAEGWAKRCGLVQWGPGTERRRSSASNWKKPLQWNRQAEIQFNAWQQFKAANPGLTDEQLIEQGFIKPQRPRVFCASLADVFDNQVPSDWRRDLFDLIELTPYLDWLLVTKRIGNVVRLVSEARTHDWLAGRPNVWLGITVVNQEEADRDIPKLLQTPARVRFLSMEPLLGHVDLRNIAVPKEHDALRRPWDFEGYKFNALQKHDDDRFHQAPATLDWVVVGGESGPKARPMSPDWARDLRDQCKAAGVPFLFKQWGEWLPMLGQVQGVPVKQKTKTPDGWIMGWAGKKAAGRRLDGVQHDGYPGGAA